MANGIDTKYFKPLGQEATTDLIFVGNMGYHPNILAAEYIVRKIVPHLSKQVSLEIAGARPEKRILRLAGSNVNVTGWVDDIRTAYARARIFVAPIFSGAGQQNKILEAMSMGQVCITTSNVNSAIGAIDGRHLLIADDELTFAKRITEVLDNIDVYEKMRKEARNYVKEHFSWQVENNKLHQVITKLGKVKHNDQ